MKQRFLIISLLVLSTFSLRSQDYHMGLRLGYSLSELTSDNEALPSLKNRRAFQFGFVHTFKPANGMVGFSIETGYLFKGARIDNDTLDYRMHFLSMPVLLDLYPTEKLRLSFGPEFNYMTNGKIQLNDSTTRGLNNTYNRWEVAAVASATYSLDYFVDISVRYSQGINNLANADAILSRRRIRSSSLQIFLYFKIAN